MGYERENPAHELVSQQHAPILEALAGYQNVTRFHMPGHRGGEGAEDPVLSLLGRKAFVNDVTGVPGMDDLHEPAGAIEKAQALAAKAFGADHTFFSVGGTSGAIHAMIMAVCGDGDGIIIPRNVHKSVLGGLIMSGAKPLFIQPLYDSYLGFALGVDERAVAKCLQEHPDCRGALLVNPTYYGVSVDLSPVASSLHQRGKVLLVDEAHGPHFRFHPKLPEPALDQGADAAAQGAHKMLGAFTQASYLHTKGNLLDVKRLKSMFRHLTTTSPSYLLLASLDAARRHMVLQGKDLLQRALDLAEYLRGEINQIPDLYAFGEEILGKPGAHGLDPTKLTVTVRELGITGYQAERFLRRERNIQVEMSDLYNLLVIVSFGNTEKDATSLVDALKDLSLRARKGGIPKHKTIDLPQLPPAPPMAMTPRQAATSPSLRVPTGLSKGRISAEVVTCYPPGIPILFPGEIISPETLSYLQVMKRLAFGISGPEDISLETLRVVKE